ncbi:MAG: hypothetical protein RMK74_01405 [Myxococcales bacterium]|nr:hypothetical protein [Myxococcales bacterium]
MTSPERDHARTAGPLDRIAVALAGLHAAAVVATTSPRPTGATVWLLPVFAALVTVWSAWRLHRHPRLAGTSLLLVVPAALGLWLVAAGPPHASLERGLVLVALVVHVAVALVALARPVRRVEAAYRPLRAAVPVRGDARRTALRLVVLGTTATASLVGTALLPMLHATGPDSLQRESAVLAAVTGSILGAVALVAYVAPSLRARRTPTAPWRRSRLVVLAWLGLALLAAAAHAWHTRRSSAVDRERDVPSGPRSDGAVRPSRGPVHFLGPLRAGAYRHVMPLRPIVSGVDDASWSDLAGRPLALAYADTEALARLEPGGELPLDPPFHVSDDDAYLVLPSDVGLEIRDILLDGDLELLDESLREARIACGEVRRAGRGAVRLHAARLAPAGEALAAMRHACRVDPAACADPVEALNALPVFTVSLAGRFVDAPGLQAMLRSPCHVGVSWRPCPEAPPPECAAEPTLVWSRRLGPDRVGVELVMFSEYEELVALPRPVELRVA